MDIWVVLGDTMNYSKKPGFFKEQNVGFSAQIYRVTMTKTWFKKKGMLDKYKVMSTISTTSTTSTTSLTLSTSILSTCLRYKCREDTVNYPKYPVISL